MGTKTLKISTDSGATFQIFPGDTADIQNQATQIKDTVFGQSFESNQTGMINGTMSCNAYYKGFAGYVAKINKGGTSTIMTAEACTLVSGKTYQITNAAHRWIDHTSTLTVLDNAVDQTAQVLSIDYLFGKVTFKSSYTPTGPITVTGKYLPMSQIAKVQSWTLTMNAATKEVTDFISAQSNNGTKSFDYALKSCAADLSGIYAITNGWISALNTRSNLYVEFNPDGAGLSVARGIFKPMTQGQSGKVGDNEVEAIKLDLYVPNPALYPLFTSPFSWVHDPTTTLATAIQNALTAWANGTLPILQYLYDGTNGQQSNAVITDMSMTGGLDVMNAFSIKGQLSGGLTAVGTG